jgi:hypothetical protein
MYAKYSSTWKVKELPMFFPCLFYSVPVGQLFFISSKKQRNWIYVVFVASSTILFYRYEARWNIHPPPNPQGLGGFK